MCRGLLLAAAACTAPAPPPKPAAAAAVAKPAGAVEAVEGRATAQRAAAGAAARGLAVRDPVWPDDTVVTAAQASVAIRLQHNDALWLLQGGQTRRVDAAAAWRAPKQAAQVALADRQAAPTTASAGRHSEQEAAQTGETAARPTPPNAADKAAADARHKQLEDAIKKQGVLGIVGHRGENGGMKDVFGSSDDNGLQGMAIGTGGLGLSGLGDGGGGLGTGGIGLRGIGEVRTNSRVTLQPKVLHGKAKAADLQRWSNHAKLLIQKAYLQALKRDVKLAGTVVVAVRVADGRVTEVKLVSTHAPDALAACVTGPLATLQQAGLGPLELRIVVQLAGLR